MHIISATSPQWANTEQSDINLNANFEGIGILPFSATANDTEAHGRDLFARAVAGEFGAIAALPPLPLAAVKAAKLSQLERSRDAATIGNVTAHGRQWQADERSQKLLSSAITLAMAGAPLPPVWRDVANNNMTITVIGELVVIAGAMAVQTQAAYSKSWTLKVDVAAALTTEAVDLIAW